MNACMRVLCLMFALVAATASDAAWSALSAKVSPVKSTGDGTYTVTVKATHKFTRNTEKLKEQAIATATEFCTKDGKQLKVVSFQEDRPQYLVGDFPEVTLTFKASTPGEQESPAVTAAPAAPLPAPKAVTTDELGAELTKLDELRKKGLLTDAEFDALKQKLLSRY